MPESPLILLASRYALSIWKTPGEDVSIVHKGSGAYYGLAYDQKHLYVCARNKGRGDPCILVFDADLHVIDCLHAPFRLGDMHQSMVHEGALYITCSEQNMIAIYDLGSHSWEKWYPSGVVHRDINHFNSIWIDDEQILLCAHNRRSPDLSEIWFFDRDTRRLLDKMVVGESAHNVWKEGEEIFTFDSRAGQLWRSLGPCIQLDEFPRGVVHIGGLYYVGTSKFESSRKVRETTHGGVICLDASWNLLYRRMFRLGAIYELRSPAETDACLPFATKFDLSS